jgi:hypothetical protein
MRSPLIALCRVLRRLPQFGVFIAFASALFAQAALAGGTGKGNGSGNPPDSKNWTGFGWGLGLPQTSISAAIESPVHRSIPRAL